MNRNIFYWALYDFANSVVMIVFLFYFSQWIVIDSGKPDWWYNGALIAASVLFVATAPIIGQRIDIDKRKLPGLRITTAISLTLHAAVALVALFFPELVFLAVTLFSLALFFYLLSFVYYTPMLDDLSDGGNTGSISGMGQGMNYLGQVFGLLVTLPLATGSLVFFGDQGRAQTLLPAVAGSFLLSLPMLLWYHEPGSGTRVLRKIPFGEEWARAKTQFRSVLATKSLVLFFVAYFLFGDALLTFANNFPIFLEKVFGASDAVKTYLSVGILTIAGVGSIAIGKIADKKGNAATLTALLVAWCVLFPTLAFAPSFPVAIATCLVAGSIFAATFGISRVLIIELSPKETIGTSFSYYVVAERFATFIGPLVWSFVLVGTVSSGARSYAYAILSMGVLVFISLFFMVKIPKE